MVVFALIKVSRIGGFMTAPNRRRNYFIDKRVQGMWALLNLLLAGTIGMILAFEILRSFYVEFGWPLGGKPFNLPDLFFIIKLVILALVGSGFIWILSAFAGHRIAGPIYRLNQSLKEVIKGNYNIRIQLRKKDFFQEVADTFNEMNKVLGERFNERDQLISQVKDKVKQLPNDNTQINELKKILGL